MPPAPEIRVEKTHFNPALFYLSPLPPAQPVTTQRDVARLVTILHASLLSCRANVQEIERINNGPAK